MFRQRGIMWFFNQRGTFAKELFSKMKENSNIYLLTGDLGYGMFDTFPLTFNNRYVNCGASEQVMLDIACGLAIQGKIPFVYSCTSFLLCRAFETIRTYINYEKLNVKLVGSGRDKDYLQDGISHWAEDDKDIMKLFPHIRCFRPEIPEDVPIMLNEMLIDGPCYINLRR